MTLRILPSLSLAAAALLSLPSHACQPPSPTLQETADTARPEPVTRLDIAMVEGRDISPSDPGLNLWHSVTDNKMTTAQWARQYRQSQVIDVFGHDALRLLPRLDTLETVLGHVRDKMTETLPDVRWRPIYAVVTPYNQGVILGDSAVLVSLSRYMGSDYEGYEGLPAYQRANMRPDRIPAAVAEALIRTAYPLADSLTALQRLIYEGAVVEALDCVLPYATTARAMGVDIADYNTMAAREDDVWRSLVASQALFSTDRLTHERMTQPAPHYTLAGEQLPARTPVYIGWRMVLAYLDKHHDVTLPMLLSPEQYQRRAQEVVKAYTSR